MEGAPLPDAPMEGMPPPPLASTSASELKLGPMEGTPTPASTSASELKLGSMEGPPTPALEPTFPVFDVLQLWGSLPPSMTPSPSSTPRSDRPPSSTSSEITLEEAVDPEAAAVDASAAWAELEAGRDAAVLEGWLLELAGCLEEDLAAERQRTVDSEARTRASSTPDTASLTWDVENLLPAACKEEALRDASKAQSEGQRDASKASSTPDTASCKPWRLISARRRKAMKQHHGKTPLHKAAWYCECITCGAFSVACLVMLCLWARHVNDESFVNTFFVTAIAAMTYFAKSCHMGDTIINGDLVPFARYIDWITTTPLMLYELCHIAHATTPMVTMVIMSDLLMLASGIIAAVIPWKAHKELKQVWFGGAVFFYIILVVVLHVDVGYKASKQIEVAANLFKQLEVLTTVVWSFYPVIVGIGRAHLGLITRPTEDICLCILDVVSKIGMDGLIVASCFNGCIEEGDH